MLVKIFKLLIGLLLIPLNIGLSKALYVLLTQVRVGSRLELWFICGLGAYGLLFALGHRMRFLYVFGHESVHALLALLSGGRVKSFRVSAHSGAVATTTNNFFITLGPYLLPFYPMLLGLGFAAAHFLAADISRIAGPFFFLLGTSIAFHLFMTVAALAAKQPDIIQQGRFFSLALVYCVNILLVAFLISLVFREVSFPAFVRSVRHETADLCRRIGSLSFFLRHAIAPR